MTAARRGETALALAELQRGVRVDRLDDYGLSALMRAAAWGHDETVRALLKAGADANLMNGGRTALHLAAQFGRIPVIRTLVGGKARLDPRFSARDPTPLFAAVKAGRSDSVRVLLDLGAESASGDSSLTPLEYAIWRSGGELRRRDERHFTTSNGETREGPDAPATIPETTAATAAPGGER